MKNNAWLGWDILGRINLGNKISYNELFLFENPHGNSFVTSSLINEEDGIAGKYLCILL